MTCCHILNGTALRINAQMHTLSWCIKFPKTRWQSVKVTNFHHPRNMHSKSYQVPLCRTQHRYLWTGPYVAPFFFLFFLRCWPPHPLFFFFFKHRLFFHINNILQLSMYHYDIYNKYNQTVVSIHAGFLTWYKLEGKSLFFVYIGVLVVHSS